MVQRIKKAMRGFTLIELLVVIAIIGLLASIVLVSLSSARRKARDSRRVGDLRQIQLALELFFDDNQEYPVNTDVAAGAVYTLTQAGASFETDLAADLVPDYVGGLPVDPSDDGTAGSTYQYGYIPGDNQDLPRNCDAAADSCLHYILVAMIEDADNLSLDNDNDNATGGFAALNGFNCADDGTAPEPYCVGA